MDKLFFQEKRQIRGVRAYAHPSSRADDRSSSTWTMHTGSSPLLRGIFSADVWGDEAGRAYKSSKSPAGISISMLSRARSLSITGYAAEIGLSTVSSTISRFFLGLMFITSGLGCPKWEEKSHE